MSQADHFGMVRKPILPSLPRPQWLYTSPRRVCPLGTAERRGGGHWRKGHTGLTHRKAPLRPHKPQPALSSPNITTLSFSCLPVPSAHYLLGEASLSAKWNASLFNVYTASPVPPHHVPLLPTWMCILWKTLWNRRENSCFHYSSMSGLSPECNISKSSASPTVTCDVQIMPCLVFLPT